MDLGESSRARGQPGLSAPSPQPPTVDEVGRLITAAWGKTKTGDRSCRRRPPHEPAAARCAHCAGATATAGKAQRPSFGSRGQSSSTTAVNWKRRTPRLTNNGESSQTQSPTRSSTNRSKGRESGQRPPPSPSTPTGSSSPRSRRERAASSGHNYQAVCEARETPRDREHAQESAPLQRDRADQHGLQRTRSGRRPGALGQRDDHAARIHGLVVRG